MKSARAGFVTAVRELLAARQLSARAAASNAGLPARSVQGVLEAHVPSIDRAAEICEAPGLEFRPGPARSRAPGRGESSRAGEPGTARAAVTAAPTPGRRRLSVRRVSACGSRRPAG